MSLSKPARKKINMNGIDPDRAYPMTLPILGHAVIINNLGDEFKGTKVDVEALEETFNAVGFITHVYNNCTKQEMWKIRSKFTRDNEHSKCNCFLMVVMCHGTKKGKLLDVKGNEAFRINQLIEEVSATKTLNGKPKLFIFDTCRGDDECYENRGKASPDSNEQNNSKDIKWPDQTDVFVAYPTMPGYQAYGGDDDGSIYQQALAQCLIENYKTHDLSAIHRMVKQIMAREAQGDNTMQPAEERNGLRYRLKFGDFSSHNVDGPSHALNLTSGVEHPRIAGGQQKMVEPQNSNTIGRILRTQVTGNIPFNMTSTINDEPKVVNNVEGPSYALNLTSGVENMRIAGGPKKTEKPPGTNTTAQILKTTQVSSSIPSNVPSAIIDQPIVVNNQGILKLKKTFSTTLSIKGISGRSRIALISSTSDMSDIAILGKNEEDSPAIFVYHGTTGGVELKKKINFLCKHEKGTHILPFTLEGNVKLIASCTSCNEISLCDANTSELTTALKHHSVRANFMFAGDTGYIYTAWIKNGSTTVCKLDCSQSKFTVCKSVQIEKQTFYHMCYVPNSKLLAVTSSSMEMVEAFSSETGQKVWEIRDVEIPRCIVYSPEHDALLIGASQSRVLVVDPEEGTLRHTLYLNRQLGTVLELTVHENNMFVRQNNFNGNICNVSCFALQQ